MVTQVALDSANQTFVDNTNGNTANKEINDPQEKSKAFEISNTGELEDNIKNQRLEQQVEKEAEVSEEELEQALDIVAEFMNFTNRNVNFARADGSDKTVIKIFDAESKELIKQFPSEQMLDIARRISELRQDLGEKTGILLDEKV